MSRLYGTCNRRGQAATAMMVAFYALWVSDVLYVIVALMWLIPDRRIEWTLAE